MITTARSRNRGIGALAALLIVSLTASYVFADELTSSSFNFNDSGFTQLGGFSSTTNFQQFGTLQPVADGESSSTHFSLSSGYLYPADTSPFKQQNWQWFDDSYDGTPAIAYASENVSPSAIPYDDPMKLRVTVNDVAGAGQANIKFRLQYSTSSDFSTGAVYVGEIGECATTVWCFSIRASCRRGR